MFVSALVFFFKKKNPSKWRDLEQTSEERLAGSSASGPSIRTELSGESSEREGQTDGRQRQDARVMQEKGQMSTQ